MSKYNKLQEVDRLYKKSITIDGLIWFFSCPLILLGTNGFLILLTDGVSNNISTPVLVSVLFAYFFASAFLKTYTFGNQSIGMKLCNIELKDESDTFYQKLVRVIYRTIIISKFNPYFGPSFEDCCRDAEIRTGTKIVLVKK